MPLLNRKRVPLTPNIPYDPKRKRKEVWYLRFTNEVFTSYESYINKLSLYHQAIWECEVTGRKNLTYEQALESERNEHDRAEYRFSEALRKSILTRVQFQTLHLDELVHQVYSYFLRHYCVDEIVNCRLNGYDYFARVIDIIPVQILSSIGEASAKSILTYNSNSENDDEAHVPRQPNGRLRFPDAFLHPTSPAYSETDSMADINEREEFVTEYQYKIQLVDNQGQPLENWSRVVERHQMSRDGYSFNITNVQCFIRECCYKEAYVNSPWLIRPSIAIAYGIDTTLPHHLREIQDQLFARAYRKRKNMSYKTSDEREAEKRARREENLLIKAKLKEERDRLREERKKQAAVKYPVEDLDLPIYRKDPNCNWALVDMAPHKYSLQDGAIPYPSGGRSERPVPHRDSSIPPELFDIFLSTWAFLTVYAEPLKLTAYSVDEFEKALLHNTHQPKATVLVDYNACLLNVIIRERKEDTSNEIINGDVMETYLESLEEEEEEEEEEEAEDNDDSNDKNGNKQKQQEEKEESVLPRVERGWRDKDHLRFSQRWDSKELRANYEHRGWESTLIGCLNDIATPELLPNVDELLCHLNPRLNSSAADREKQYPTLTVAQKLDILSFLVDVVNESTVIKNYMDYCQDQLSEFRKQKVELNKEVKAVTARRAEMDKRDKQEKAEQNSDNEDDDDEDDDEDDSNTEDSDNSDAESDTSDNRLATRERKHLSRQEKVRIKQKEKEERELRRKKQYEEQRQVAKDKKQEQRNRANERRKLEEDERSIKRKEEHLEKNMRRYMTLRIRPLGKDRFSNRYIYLDNVGVSDTYGSGRLYVCSPSDEDILLMMERDRVEDLPERAWGYGGGRWFIKQLMQAQGFSEESIWLEKRMDELDTESPSEYQGWWGYYSEPDEIEQLLLWLNPKGIREHKLKNEVMKQHANIADSFKKRADALTKKEQDSDEEPIPKRSTRSKSHANRSSSLTSKS